MRAVIVAFDGVLADTLPLRAHALVDAANAEGQQLASERVLQALHGRTLLEAALALFPHHAAHDPTLPELVALRAQRSYRQLVQFGVPVHPEVQHLVQHAAARGVRVVLRADSERREVEPLLAMAGVEHAITMMRCSDDAPRGADPSLARSWRAIDARLRALQLQPPVRTAWETAAAETVQAAGEFVTIVQSYPALSLD
ncbi:HAD family hydrolase [Gemmatimonas sp.]